MMKTFYLRNVSMPHELQEAANTSKSILDLTRIQLIPNQNAMILRGTTDQMVLAQKLLTDIDKPKPEVVIDIAVLQVSRSRIRYARGQSAYFSQYRDGAGHGHRGSRWRRLGIGRRVYPELSRLADS